MPILGITSRSETAPIERGGWLDALRIIVACLIVVHHFQGSAPIPLEQFHPIFERSGFLLTNFFIIDSGYVLMRIYGPRALSGRVTPAEFVRKRALRVIPCHLVMVGLLVAMVLGAGALGMAPDNPKWFDWSQLPAQALLVQSFGVPGGLGWNAPSWSISALLGCYLAFPWIVRPMSRLKPWTLLVAAVVFYLTANLACWTLLGHPVWQMPMKYGFIRAFPLFILGMSLAWLAHRVFIPARLAAWVGLSAAVAFFALQLHDKHALLAIACLSLIILAAGAVPVTRPSRIVEKGALMAFAIFITNEVVRIGWFGVMDAAAERLGLNVGVQWALWAAGMVAAIAFAWAFYHLIDRPTQRLLNRPTTRQPKAGYSQALGAPIPR